MKQWGGDQNYRPEKRRSDKKKRRARDFDAQASKDAATKVSTERDFRVGRTIAGATNNARKRNLEHIAARKKKQRRNAIIVLVLLIAVGVVGVFIGKYINEKLAEREVQANTVTTPTEPTVPIVDENVGNNISKRMKIFVARLEDDAKDYKVKIDHVALPYQKAREVLVYFVGRKEYYKMTTDRGSTVQIEDAERMMRYLDQKSLKPKYVDIRIEGKAYYK